MKFLSKEKSKVLAERNGWTLARAEGYVDGEGARKRGAAAAKYLLVGIDEYCQGFRAGYFAAARVPLAERTPPSEDGKHWLRRPHDL